MANKLFESLGGGRGSAPAVTPQNMNTPSFWQQVDQMKRSIVNPQAEVQKLLDSGQMSRQEFEQIGQFASQMLQMRRR